VSRFDEVERLFHDVRGLDADARVARLDEACANDAELRREVEELLLHSEGAALDEPALGRGFLKTGSAERPERIGPYTILDTIGRGGMGIVYRAEQEHPKRQVALKVIRTLLVDDRLVRRFEREAELLGRLRHPGIARVYEAGLVDETPFIAMELIDGQPLTEFVATAKPDVPARLRLFASICDAVEHAHKNGVIHRDLKPSNILVEVGGAGPQPRIVDFGVARATDADLSGGTLWTSAGELVGTIEYMSPEQAAGDPLQLDTQSDVYSLGVILYELLSGALPYDVRDRTIHEAARIVREQEARPIGQLDAMFRGDLSTIVGKALEKEKSQRYLSASALGEDVRRFLDDEPIAAHPPSTTYQLRKFARRHRALVTLTGAVLIALVIGLFTTLTQWLQTREQQQLAERRYDDVRELAHFLIFDIDEAMRNVSGTLPARKLLVEAGVEYLDKLAAEVGDDPALLNSLIGAYSAIGDIQGAPTLPNVGDIEGAKRSYEQALILIDRLMPLHDQPGELQRSRSLTLMRLGDVLLWRGEVEDALSAYRDAEQLVFSWPDATTLEQVQVIERIGDALLEQGELDQALQHYLNAERQTKLAAEQSPLEWGTGRAHAAQLLSLGAVYEQLGRADEALDQYRRFLEFAEPAARRESGNAVAQRDLIVGAGRLGDLLAALGRHEEALQHHAAAVSAGEALVAADPGNAQALMTLSGSCNKLGELLLAAARRDEARQLFDRYLGLAEELVALDANDSNYQRRYGVALYKQSELDRSNARDESLTTEERLSHWTSARGWLQRATDVFVAMGANGLLQPSDAGVPDELRGELADCDANIELLADAGAP